MCEDCGCQEGNKKKYFEHKHTHEHGTYTHSHDGSTHTHEHHHDHLEPEKRILKVEQNVLAKNDAIAAQNRKWLKSRGIVAINLISSPGSGKTTLLEKTLEKLSGEIECAVIVGDQCTDNDAKRLMDKCGNVYQIQTHSSCHLDAKQISDVLETVVDKKTKILFIENVGNLICPAAFDLGEDFKIALLSTTEGEDKPVKYPVIFSDAQVVVLTKTDLIPHLDWNIKKCRDAIQQINPGVFAFELSAKTDEGMDIWINYLKKLV